MGALAVQSGIPKSQVSLTCLQIDGHVQAFLSLYLQESDYGYVPLNLVCCRALVVAMDVTT